MVDKIGKLVGSGGTSEVYEWGDAKVIKIYKPHVGDNVINHEMYIGELLNQFSLNIPTYFGSIDYYGKKAIIYKRISGKMMADILLEEVDKEKIANIFAQMHYEIHKKKINELPSQFDFLKSRMLELRNILGDKTIPLLNLLDSIPIENSLCHGDYQPMNIIGDVDKYIVIDWNGACSGSPVLDVAWSYLTLNSPYIKHLLGETISEIVVKFTKDYLSYYCELSGTKKEDILKYLPLVAARRFYDNNMSDNEISRQEREWLLDFIQRF